MHRVRQVAGGRLLALTAPSIHWHRPFALPEFGCILGTLADARDRVWRLILLDMELRHA